MTTVAGDVEAAPRRTPLPRDFVVLWAGQTASMTGSALSGFALGVYVYQLTGSATTLGFVYALALLPLTLASPFTGSLVDRWGPRRAMLVGNAGAMATMLVLALLLATGAFEVWHVYVVVTVNSVLRALHLPAFEASVPLLVPKEHIARANGMRMFGLAASQVLAPVAAGFVLLAIRIQGIILLDCVSFGLAIASLLVVRIRPPVRRETTAAGAPSLLAEFGQAWRYVVERPGLLGLLLFIAALNFAAGVVDLLITPRVLAFASADALGAVLSAGGLGMVAAGLVLTVWGGPRRRVRAIHLSALALAAATVVGSMRPNVVLVAAGAFLFLSALAVVITTNQGIWQTKVEPAMLGRAMALVTMVASAPQLLAYALAGLASDRLVEPLVAGDPPPAAVAALVGSGPGRAPALLMMTMGGLIVVITVVASLHPRLRHLETELPDLTPDDAGESAEEAPSADGPALAHAGAQRLE